MRWWGWTVLCAGAAAVFAVSGLGGPLSSLAAAVFLVAVPGLALAQRSVQAAELQGHRTAAYASSAVALVVMALWAWWVWPETARGLWDWLSWSEAGRGPGVWFTWSDQEHGQGGWPAWPRSVPGLLGAAVILTAGGLAICYGFRALGDRRGWEETEVVRAFIPATSGERDLFTILSITAGVCEEIVYRGFLPLFLMPWFGDRYLLAALPVTAVFGILHAYQSAHGMVRTAAMGLILAVGVAWTGSLLPSILAHGALNLLIGLVLADSLLEPAKRKEKRPKWR